MKSKNRELSETGPHNLWYDMDRLFDQFKSSFNDLFFGMPPTRSLAIEPSEFRLPLSDIYDHGDRYEMNIELPGLSKEDVNIEVTPYDIEISATTSKESNKEEKNWIHKERSNFSYYRHFDLPGEIKADNVEAVMNDGVLNITIPKEHPSPEYKAKKIKIK
jgi:HSP20 family protein